MERITHVERTGVLTRELFKIGERMFGPVPTAERLMARRRPLMLGIGDLYGTNRTATMTESTMGTRRVSVFAGRTRSRL